MQAVTAVAIGSDRLTIEGVIAVAQAGARVALPIERAFAQRIEAGAKFVDELLRRNGTIYGVTTGYGDSCTVSVPPELVSELPTHLMRYHGCGLGRMLTPDETLPVLVARLNSLAQGYSGVRLILLERLAALINRRILPLIPAEGSVGASGDLTPLSYVAAALTGEGEVLFRGERCSAQAVLGEADLPPFSLAPKEGLALMNGTAVMTGLACLAWTRAEYLSRLCCRLTAMAATALRSNRDHFHPLLFAVKPHAGQNEAAAWIYDDLVAGAMYEPARLQERYSIRCAPHVIGVLRDALGWMRRDIENELNSANDNPIIDADAGLLFHGGHFYGGHIAFAMDALKTAVANLSDLMDRQLALLVDANYNGGLPQHLSGASGPRAAINHGLKAVQIGASAWTAEALKLTMPASVFSRSTECHNQDKVSMGTIAARDCLRVLQLSEQVAAAETLAVTQAILLRHRAGRVELAPEPAAFVEAVQGEYEFLDEDRPLEPDLRRVVSLIQQRHWPLYN
jgi:histidine ammonia-lyase